MVAIKPLSKIDSVDWANLTHAYGPADDVPAKIRGLLSPEHKARKQALWSLYGNIVHQGTRYEAASYAVPFLLGMLPDVDESLRADLVEYLLHLALGYWEDQMPEPFDPQQFRCDMRNAHNSLTEEQKDQNKEYGFSPMYLIEVYDAVLAGVPDLLPFLPDRDETVREMVAHALAWFPEASKISVPALWHAFKCERNPSCIIAIGFALGRLLRGQEGEEELKAAFHPLINSDDLLTRAAAFAALAEKPLSSELMSTAQELMSSTDALDQIYSGNVNEGSLDGYARFFVEPEPKAEAPISGALKDGADKVETEESVDTIPSSNPFRRIWIYLTR